MLSKYFCINFLPVHPSIYQIYNIIKYFRKKVCYVLKISMNEMHINCIGIKIDCTKHGKMIKIKCECELSKK